VVPEDSNTCNPAASEGLAGLTDRLAFLKGAGILRLYRWLSRRAILLAPVWLGTKTKTEKQMKQLAIKSLGLLVICGVLAGVVSGCAWSIGDGKNPSVVQKTTKGQELIDLKRAKDQGAITEDEYNSKRQEILNR
jgi:hypothetical protein